MSYRPEECHCDCHGVNTTTKEVLDSIAVHVEPCCYHCSNCGLNISTYAYDDHKKQCKHILDVELGYFDQHRGEWCKHHLGKFALIKGTNICDFCDTQERAYEVGYRIWGLVPFLIKEVQLIDRIIFMPDRVFIDVLEEDQDKKE